MAIQTLKKQIKQDLINSIDYKYKKFHTKLCPGTNNILGVRTPVIKNYAKDLLKEYSFEEVYQQIDDEYYEEIMLKGILIGMQKGNIKEIKNYIKDFIPKIDNWAVCDTFCAGLKITKKHLLEMRDFILTYQSSNKEFELRFMLVMILDYYITEEYLQENFKIFDKVKSKDYYVEMALAWAISISFIKFYDETKNYLKTSNLSDFVYNKSISKACDSYRISDSKKQELKKLRR